MQQLTLLPRQRPKKLRRLGQKAPFKLNEIWAIRTRLEIYRHHRDLALFNLAIDSKLRGCDLVSLKVSDVASGEDVLPRAMIIQQKTGRPVQFEITMQTRNSLSTWIINAGLQQRDFLFPTRADKSKHLSTRQYARLVKSWSSEVGLDPTNYGTHSLRRTKATLIYRNTKNLRAVQLLLGHTKLESTVRYLGVEVEDALEISERTEAEPITRQRTSGMGSTSDVCCAATKLPETTQTGPGDLGTSPIYIYRRPMWTWRSQWT